ncbi:mechanosensitive ion channel domain-containing protein [Methylobrevis pamukkalensis]|uniref:Moderate conductance mechanosensitive channel YbiO n=1 Tax=Methylobrevis pamukkalensis TaxID=1439726 RepID=A0A1E3GX56_9HYPH|nr:mechanosensitive ion channel domain-containing protein [Methylobrevis pamukkalensis]ODN68603.1 Moderate conductance mechanosensitive channel YbiO precursor [Methylobrevis pamukkalensis]
MKAARDALIRVLSDERKRAQFLKELEGLDAGEGAAAAGAPAAGAAAGGSAAAGATSPPATTDEAALPLPQQFGEYTREVGEDLRRIFGRTWTSLLNLQTLVDGSLTIDWAGLWSRYETTALLIAVALPLIPVMRFLLRPAFGWLDRRADGQPLLRRLLPATGAVLLDVLMLVIALFVLVAIALRMSTSERLDTAETLFLSAFLATQLARLTVRAVFRPLHPHLRLLPCRDDIARHWTRRIGGLATFVGYSMLFFVPMVTYAISFRVGIGVRMAIVLIATLAAIVMVVANRTEVRRELVDASNRVRSRTIALILVRLSAVWHLLVIAYLLTGFIVWSTRPADALAFMLVATLWSLAAIVVGALVMRVLNGVSQNGLKVPQRARAAMPMLEQRVNLFVPALLTVLRVFIAVAVLLAVLHAWSLIDVTDWLATGDGAPLFRRFITAFIMVVVLIVAWLAATSWIEYQLNPNSRRAASARMRTLFALLRNALTVLFVTIGSMLVLSELGIDIAPLIAGAGVVGLAISFGAQKLVQDIITGAFLQFENALNEGDVVTVAGISGVVEHLTIRSVGLRDVSGVFHVIPFSSVDAVSNAMRGFAFHVADIQVAYRANLDEVKRLMLLAFDRLMETEHGPYILEPLDMQGVLMLAENAVTVRARIKTAPGKQWAAGRAYTEIVKLLFDEHGIEIPFPQRTIWIGDAKDNEEPRLPLDGKSAGRGGKPQGSEPPSKRGAAAADRAPAETLDVPDSPDDDGNVTR